MLRLAVWLLVLISGPVLALSSKAVLEIKDDRFEQELRFNVSLPRSYQHEPEKHYVLMFDFHPVSHTYLAGLHDWMSHNGEWPWLETIIVSPEMGNPVGKLFDSSGKQTPLLDFFEEQLIPAIDEQYRTNGFRIISGFRYNGSVVLSSLLNKPQLFDAHIAISPELKDNVAGLLTGYKNKLAQLPAKPRFLFLAHAESVKEDHQLDEYQQLAQTIVQKQPAHLDYHYRTYQQHYHMSLPPLATIEAIELIFNDIHRGLPADSPISNQGVNAIVQHYLWLSKEKYGFPVSAKRSIRNLAEHQLPLNPEQAIATYKKLIELNPEDAYSYHYLADAYAQTNQPEKAIKLQKQAVALATGLATWHQKRMKRFLTQYESETSK